MRVRCYFFRAQKVASLKEKVGYVLDQIGRLYDVEQRLCNKGAGAWPCVSVYHCRFLRSSKPGFWPMNRPQGKPGLPPWHWEWLCQYTQDGHVEIGNNLVENAIRSLTLGRKNYLFAGVSRMRCSIRCWVLVCS